MVQGMALHPFMISPSGSLSEIPPKLGRYENEIQAIENVGL
jgi:hypothetical protein